MKKLEPYPGSTYHIVGIGIALFVAMGLRMVTEGQIFVGAIVAIPIGMIGGEIVRRIRNRILRSTEPPSED